MKMPGRAPCFPAVHEPSVLVTLPCSSSSAVSSPRYQTLPALSCAYQSLVRSSKASPMYNMSCTTTALTPSTTFVAVPTVTTSREASPSFEPVYFHTEPGSSGNHVLSTRGVAGKFAAAKVAPAFVVGVAVTVGSGVVRTPFEPLELQATSNGP